VVSGDEPHVNLLQFGKRNPAGNAFCAFRALPFPVVGCCVSAVSQWRTRELTRCRQRGPGFSLGFQSLAVLGVCALSHHLRRILGLPAQLIKDILPTGTCTNEVPGTFGMYLCSI
jgi:hypothetical protein